MHGQGGIQRKVSEKECPVLKTSCSSFFLVLIHLSILALGGFLGKFLCRNRENPYFLCWIRGNFAPEMMCKLSLQASFRVKASEKRLAFSEVTLIASLFTLHASRLEFNKFELLT